MSLVNQSIIKHKMGLLNLAEELQNVSQACRVMGVSRDTFYRVKEAKESGGMEALLHKDRRRANLKNRMDPATEQAILAFAVENPAAGQFGVPNELRKRNIVVSPTGVRSVWLRTGLQTFRLRLAALEKKVAEEGMVLTERQIAALERKRDEQMECGEIETAHPGYLGSHDTFCVGNMKGVGRIYQQTFVDTYAKVAFAKLYTTKTPLAAADLLNDQVLPFFEQNGVELLRVLTDRGTEYCGKVEQHEYQLYLAVNDVDHTRTKAQSPQTNGICERFHKTILNEFYQIAFRKKIYMTLQELQVDLDAWIYSYNHERTHQGKMCCGRTPIETFEDGKRICREKSLSLN